MSENSLEDDYCVLKLRLQGHKKPITDLSFHPGGKQFASSSEDHSIMIWNMQENTRTYSFMGHSDVVTSVKYSPNGKLLASSSQDQTVRIWVPTITGTSTDFKAHTSAVRTLAFSPDSDKLITGANDKSIKLWNVRRKQFLLSYVGHNNWVRSVQFSPKGDVIASCSDDKTVRIWDSKSGESVCVFNPSSKGCPTDVSFYNSGGSIAVAMDSGSVRVYDIRAQKLQQHYVLHDSTTCVCWHPCANYFVTSGRDGKVILVDVMEGRPLFTIEGHKGPVNSVQFSSDGEYFASGGADADRHIMVWKTNFVK